MFPSEEDANMTVNFLRRLKKKWPDLQYFPKLDRGESTNKPPVLTSLHIVWPWSRFITIKLARSIFCDATYNVTVFNYRLVTLTLTLTLTLNSSNFCSTSISYSLTSFRVVAITTLDGNKQHRPLMLSFILSSNNNQWTIIFDIFHRIVRDLDTEMHVVTSDQEKAIRAGLALSTFSNMTLHFICSLHVKWNVRDHK